MEAQARCADGCNRFVRDDVRRFFFQTAVAVGVMLLAGVAMVLYIRRVAGALEKPLELPTLLALFLPVAVIAVCLRWATRGRAIANSWPARWILNALPTVAMVAIAMALSIPGTFAATWAVLWGVVVVAEICSWSAFMLSGAPRPAPTIARVHRLGDRKLRFDLPHQAQPRLLGEDISQQITLGNTKDGRNLYRGWIRATFQARQRIETIHVAFCPPFETTPTLTARQVQGPPATTKISQLLPYGARLELRLDAPAEGESRVLFSFSAQEKIENRDKMTAESERMKDEE